MHSFKDKVGLFVLAGLACFAGAGNSTHQVPNKVAGAWSIDLANVTTDGATSGLYGDHPVGVLIFAPTLYFSELISIDPFDFPRFCSNTDRTTGTAAENAAVIAGQLGAIGRYNVSNNGTWKSEGLITSTFPN